jgi:hypothetical protein
MQIRESIELNVKNMKLYGIQDFGEDNVQTSKTSDQRVNHALVFMFSSVADQFCQPVAIYAAKAQAQVSQQENCPPETFLKMGYVSF